MEEDDDDLYDPADSFPPQQQEQQNNYNQTTEQANGGDSYDFEEEEDDDVSYNLFRQKCRVKQDSFVSRMISILLPKLLQTRRHLCESSCPGMP